MLSMRYAVIYEVDRVTFDNRDKVDEHAIVCVPEEIKSIISFVKAHYPIKRIEAYNDAFRFCPSTCDRRLILYTTPRKSKYAT